MINLICQYSGSIATRGVRAIGNFSRGFSRHTAALLLLVALLLGPSAHATDPTLQESITSQITTAITAYSAILAVVATGLGVFLIFKLLRRGAKSV